VAQSGKAAALYQSSVSGVRPVIGWLQARVSEQLFMDDGLADD
jgi:hypothetical protein